MLSEVRRQPNGVEAPHACVQRRCPCRHFHHGSGALHRSCGKNYRLEGPKKDSRRCRSSTPGLCLKWLYVLKSVSASMGSFDSARLAPPSAQDDKVESAGPTNQRPTTNDQLKSPPNQTCQSSSKNSESKISPALPPRGQIKLLWRSASASIDGCSRSRCCLSLSA